MKITFYLFSESMACVKEWLKSLPINDLAPVECGSDTLNTFHIENIEKSINSVKVHCSMYTVYTYLYMYMHEHVCLDYLIYNFRF